MAAAPSNHYFVDGSGAGELVNIPFVDCEPEPTRSYLCDHNIISGLFSPSRSLYFQILVGVVLFLKGSYMGGITLFLWTIPTLLFDMWIRERFMRAYHDAALLQTSRLDGWQDVHSMKEREEYRRWLVDCHKASYVPVCLLGSKGNLLTSEPAVVIARQSDVDADEGEGDRRNLMQRQSGQKGAIFSRKYK